MHRSFSPLERHLIDAFTAMRLLQCVYCNALTSSVRLQSSLSVQPSGKNWIGLLNFGTKLLHIAEGRRQREEGRRESLIASGFAFFILSQSILVVLYRFF